MAWHRLGLYLDQLPLFDKTLRLLGRGFWQKFKGRVPRLNPSEVGVSLRGKAIEVTPEKIEWFNRSVSQNAADPEWPKRVSPHASPMFGIIPAMYSLLGIFSNKNLGVDFSNLILVRQQGEFIRRVHPGERIFTRSTVKDIVQKESGQLLIIQSEGFTLPGEKIFQDDSSFYIRNPRKFFSGMKELRQEETALPQPPAGKFAYAEDFRIPQGQIGKYSKISGDYNPFHYIGVISRMFGYNEKFLPGTYLTSLLCQLLIRGILAGETDRLCRIRLSFWEKVREGDTLRTQIWELPRRENVLSQDLWLDTGIPLDPSASIFGFRVINQDECPVIPQGLAAVRKSDQSAP